MPSSDPGQRLGDILTNIARIERFTAGLDVEALQSGRAGAPCRPARLWLNLQGLFDLAVADSQTGDAIRRLPARATLPPNGQQAPGHP